MRRMFSEKQIEEMILSRIEQSVGEYKYRYEFRLLSGTDEDNNARELNSFIVYSKFNLLEIGTIENDIANIIYNSEVQAIFVFTITGVNTYSLSDLVGDEDGMLSIGGYEFYPSETKIIKTNLITGEVSLFEVV